MKRTLLAITFSFAMNSIVYAEEVYVAPQANKIMFHVDKLPIDRGVRRQLSMNLTILAKRSHDGSAEEHRLTAQLLMLAMRLDRENASATKLNQDLAGGGELPVSGVQKRLKAFERLNGAMKMLSKTDELDEARVLEVYLKDVLIGLDKNSPLADTHEENQERWDSIVPVLIKKVPEIDEPNPRPIRPEHREQPEHREKPAVPDSTEKRQKFTKWTKHSSGVSTPLRLVQMIDDRARYSYEVVTLNTQISPQMGMKSRLTLEMKPWLEPERVESFRSSINLFIKNLFGKHQSIKMKVTTTKHLSESNRNRMLLPLCLQLKASEKNRQVRDGIAVLGRLSGKNITRDSGFWYLLKIVRKSEAKNQRLLIPSNAEADLKQLVALQEEGFFVRNEVLLVSNIDEAVDLLGKSDNASINEASEEFSKIQQMIGTKSVGVFAVNKKIRAKLEEILVKNPNHLSAKMILLRGSATRSRKLDTYFVATELSVLLKQTSYLMKRPEDEINGDYLARLAKKIEAEVKELNPFIGGDDRELVAGLIEIARYLGTIGRAKDKRDSAAMQRVITNTLNDFKIKYLEVKTRLDKVMSKPPKT